MSRTVPRLWPTRSATAWSKARSSHCPPHRVVSQDYPHACGELGAPYRYLAGAKEFAHITMLNVQTVTDSRGRVLIQDPPIARFLFQSTVASWFWLVVRVFVGWQFLDAGWHKLNTPAWVNGSGDGIMGFWSGALAV